MSTMAQLEFPYFSPTGVVSGIPGSETAFERQERMAPDEVWSDQQKLNLIRRVEGKSTRETERAIADAAPEVVLSREGSRYLGSGKWEVRMVVPEEVWKQIETLQDLLSHRVPTRSCGELIALLARDAMAKYDPRCRGKGLRARAAAPQAAAGQSSTAPVRDLAGVTPRARPTDRGARPAPEAVLASRHIDAATARSPAASVRASVPADTAHGQVPGGPAPATAAAGIAAPLADQCSTPAQAELDVRQETPGTGLAGQPAQPATPAPEYATAKAVYRHAPCPRRGPARRVGA